MRCTASSRIAAIPGQVFFPVVLSHLQPPFFVFDRAAEGRAIKCLTLIDDATDEAVPIVAERAPGGLPLTEFSMGWLPSPGCRAPYEPTIAWISAAERC